MGKNLLVGVGSKARKVKALYVGVGGKARKVKKVYVGVGGKARLVWESYVKATDLKVQWSYSNVSQHFPMQITWSCVPASATNVNVSCTLGDRASSYFDVTELKNSAGHVTGLKLVDKAGTHKYSFNITISHPDGITYRAACSFNYDKTPEWSVTITKQ